MNYHEENPLKNQLDREIQESEWFQKFKQIGETLTQIKTEIPLTQLCELRWNTEDDRLAIHCPNLEVRSGLEAQHADIAKLNSIARRYILKSPHEDDLEIVAKPDRST
jgi:hypothetical protein